ncbi:MAG: DUF45 domain-containing protein [Spirochaetaceae bacterium]
MVIFYQEKKLSDISILSGYSDDVISKVEELINTGKLHQYLLQKYPDTHEVKNNKALYSYTNKLKKLYMKKAKPLHRVLFDDDIERTYKALGFNSRTSTVQGRKLKSTNEIRIASIFKSAPLELLDMIIVHELAHLKVKEHNKEFYKLCSYMLPNYYQLEFDIRLFLISTYNNKYNKSLP